MTISMENEYTDLMIHLEREFEVDSTDALEEVLNEHESIIDFIPATHHLLERAQAENLRLVFHVFADATDDFLEDPHEALVLYLKHRSEDKPHVRLYYELQEKDEEGTMLEENCMIGFGGYPN